MSRVCSQWAVSWLSFAILLSSAAVGCGDSDDKDSGASAGTGGSSSGGKGGSGGSNGGTGGAAAGSGGDAAYSNECVTTAKQDATGFSEACLSCACEQDESSVSKCDAACWSLIVCAGSKCGDKTGTEAQSCAQTMCGAEISASLASGSVAAVMPLSAILQGTCSASCKP